jgi:hypothetical protein
MYPAYPLSSGRAISLGPITISKGRYQFMGGLGTWGPRMTFVIFLILILLILGDA